MTWFQFWILGGFIYEAGGKRGNMYFCIICAVGDIIYNWAKT